MALKTAEQFPKMPLDSMRLYLNDIQELHALLSKSSQEIVYEHDRFVAEQPSELVDLKDKTGRTTLNELKIVAAMKGADGYFSGRLHIRLGGYSAGEIDSSNTGQEFVSLAAKSKAILDTRKRSSLLCFLHRHQWLPIPFIVVLALAATFAGLKYAPSELRGQELAFSSAISSAVFFPLLFATWFVSRISRTRIHLFKRSEHPRLFDWSDYRGWIGTAIGTVLGALALLFIQWITGWSVK